MLYYRSLFISIHILTSLASRLTITRIKDVKYKSDISSELRRVHNKRSGTLSVLCIAGQGWISDMEIDGPTFVPNNGYFLLIWVKVCLEKLAFYLLFEPILLAGF